MMESKYYTLQEAGKELGLSYTYISRKCKRLKLKLIIGRLGTKYLNEIQMNKLRKKRLVAYNDDTEPTGNVIEIIKVTEIYHIFHSKINN
jgi:AraC-like DNA-binding protein